VDGRFIVPQEKLSGAERRWTNHLNALQEAIHYSFIKFRMYWFSFWYAYFVHYAFGFEKFINMVLKRDVGISVSSAKGISHHPIHKSVALF
jgi:hypothetical protein